jgi:putative transposase
VDHSARAAAKYNVAVGRYVIMPDHVHFFIRGGPDFVLSSWVGGLKRAMSVAVLNRPQATRHPALDTRATTAVEAAMLAAIPQATRLPPQKRSVWQPGFFDHVLHTDESYAQKWNYVRENPVRAGLVVRWEEWPYQGEIVRIDRS